MLCLLTLRIEWQGLALICDYISEAYFGSNASDHSEVMRNFRYLQSDQLTCSQKLTLNR